MASLQSTFNTNYDFRRLLLDICSPSDIVLLLTALGKGCSLTKRERTKHLSLFSLIFKDNSTLVELCESHINITIFCKQIEKLGQFLHECGTEEDCSFDILIILTKDHRSVPFFPRLLSEIFVPGDTTAASFEGGTQWNEASGVKGNSTFNVRFLQSQRETICPLLLPSSTAARFMVMDWTEDVAVTTKYMHLHETMIEHQEVSALSGEAYLWRIGIAFGFRVNVGERGYVSLPIFL